MRKKKSSTSAIESTAPNNIANSAMNAVTSRLKNENPSLGKTKFRFKILKEPSTST